MTAHSHTLSQAGLRNKPSYNPTQYSVEWANVMTSYMKKQLAEIALPSAPRLVASIKQTFKGVLSDSEMRQKWISRFTYWYVLLTLSLRATCPVPKLNRGANFVPARTHARCRHARRMH